MKKIYCQTCQKWIDEVEASNFHQGHYMPNQNDDMPDIIFSDGDEGDEYEAEEQEMFIRSQNPFNKN